MRLLLGTAVAAVLLSGTVAATPATAAPNICRPFTGEPGGNATWRIHQIRLTTGFSCRDARGNIASWIGFGAMMDSPRALPPWTCAFGTVVRCRLRTSFGGTRPERTYRLRFRISNR